MNREKFEKAQELDYEINRIDMLIKYVTNKETVEIMNPKVSELGYLVQLIGTDNVISILEDKKKALETEFEKL